MSKEPSGLFKERPQWAIPENWLMIETIDAHTAGEPLRVKMSQSFWTKVGKAITTDIRRNIIKQKQADGSPLQVNKESTQKRKRAAGRPLRSLIDVERRLVRAGAFVATVLRNGVSVVPESTDISRRV